MAEQTQTTQTQEQTNTIRSKRNVKEWAKLGQDILALDLRGSQKLFLMVLVHHMNPTTGLCCPGTGTLAEELGTSPRQVRRLRSQLEDLGLIACVGVVGPESKYGKKVWTYALFIPKAKVGQSDPPQPVKGGSESPTEGVTLTHRRGHSDPPKGSHRPHNVLDKGNDQRRTEKEQQAASAAVEDFFIKTGQDQENPEPPSDPDGYAQIANLGAVPEGQDDDGNMVIFWRDEYNGSAQREAVPMWAWEKYGKRQPSKERWGRNGRGVLGRLHADGALA